MNDIFSFQFEQRPEVIVINDFRYVITDGNLEYTVKMSDELYHDVYTRIHDEWNYNKIMISKSTDFFLVTIAPKNEIMRMVKEYKKECVCFWNHFDQQFRRVKSS